MTVNVTIETRHGYTDVIPFASMYSAKFFRDCITKRVELDLYWHSHERTIKGIDITRVISVEEEN